MDLMASMAACGWRELDDEVDEDRAASLLNYVEKSGHFAGDNPACQETGWVDREAHKGAANRAKLDDQKMRFYHRSLILLGEPHLVFCFK